MFLFAKNTGCYVLEKTVTKLLKTIDRKGINV